MFARETLPAWIKDDNGRLVPFSPDSISLALFEATEQLGRPDVFLARELTAGVLFFLSSELTETAPSQQQIRELVAKVVRQFGHGELADLYATQTAARFAADASAGESEAAVSHKPVRSITDCVHESLTDFAFGRVFSKEIRSVAGSGLLSFHDPACIDALMGCTLDGPDANIGSIHRNSIDEVLHRCAAWMGKSLLRAGQLARGFFAVDGLDDVLKGLESSKRTFSTAIEDLLNAMRLSQRQAIVNLNCRRPPAWAQDEDGPLFRQSSGEDASRPKQTVAAEVLNEILDQQRMEDQWWIDWHVGASDFEATGSNQLRRVVRLALENKPVALVFDRSGAPVALGPGISREHSSSLMAIKLHLDKLHQFASGSRPVDSYLEKLESVVALAFSAAAQKRAFLQTQSDEEDAKKKPLIRQFILARSSVVLVPGGLAGTAERLAAGNEESTGSAMKTSELILARIQQVAARMTRRLNLRFCLSGLGGLYPLGRTSNRRDRPAVVDAAEECRRFDLTPPHQAGSMEEQFKQADLLHRHGRRATLYVELPKGRPDKEDALLRLIEWAWKKTKIQRLQLTAEKPRQLTFSE